MIDSIASATPTTGNICTEWDNERPSCYNDLEFKAKLSLLFYLYKEPWLTHYINKEIE